MNQPFVNSKKFEFKTDENFQSIYIMENFKLPNMEGIPFTLVNVIAKITLNHSNWEYRFNTEHGVSIPGADLKLIINEIDLLIEKLKLIVAFE